jgi:pSer/pThr/pTyr-binding forkhead associated (FHA) protein
MPLCFRVLPVDDTRPAGRAGVAGPPVEREVVIPDGLPQIRIGRRADLELPLPFAVLSSVHARLTREAADGEWVLEDLGSTNGTWLDGQRLAPGERRFIAPGTELGLGTLRLRFEGASSAAASAAGTATIARRLVDDLFADAPESAPTVRVLAGAPATALRLATEGRAYVVGRAETWALALPSDAVSREHAAFVRRHEAVVVRDLGSKNGVLVGGTRITGEHALADGDTITIGPVTLTLEDPVSRYLAELARLPAEGEPTADGGAQPETLAPAPIASPADPAPPAPPPVADSAPPAPRRKLSAARLAAIVAVSALVLLAAATVTLLLPSR